MDKKMMRRYKKSRQAQSSSESSSSSEESHSSSTYSSSESDRKRAERHRKKKPRRSTSSSDDKRDEKRDHSQNRLEAKRNHLKRKLKEAKLKKRAALAAAALSGHSHRALSPATEAKLKKIAERKHQRALNKERRRRESEKHRSAARDRKREHRRSGGSRSPTAKTTKIRIHQDVKQRQKSPQRVHHQLMSREKIIIQTRTRECTPDLINARERQQRHEHKLRHEEYTRECERRERERDRAEREAARDKERAEALARCQERQRERERIAREKLRREEEEKKYGGGPVERLLPRQADRDIAIATARGYNSRERSLESVERVRHVNKRDLDVVSGSASSVWNKRERIYLEAERQGDMLDAEMRLERDYLGEHHYAAARIHDPRDLYAEDVRERAYSRAYLDDVRHPREHDAAWLEPRVLHDRALHEMRDPRDYREVERELIYPDDRLIHERPPRPLSARRDWKNDWDPPAERDWHDATPTRRGGFIGGPKRGGGAAAVSVATTHVATPKIIPRETRASSEQDWDAEEAQAPVTVAPAKMPLREPPNRPPSEPDWDADEVQETGGSATASKVEANNSREGSPFGIGAADAQDAWMEHDDRNSPLHREKLISSSEHVDRRWQPEWRSENDDMPPLRGGYKPSPFHHARGGRGGFRRGGAFDHGERAPGVGGYRPHAPMQMMPGFHGASPRFPNKRNMTYTNPNLIKKQQAALTAAKAAAQASAVAAATTAVAAAKAAAQSAANATTNPSILGQAGSLRTQHTYVVAGNSPEAGEILPYESTNNKVVETTTAAAKTEATAKTAVIEKVSGELSEISDSDDEILNKAEKKTKAESDECSSIVTGEQDTVSVTNVFMGDAECKPDEGEETLDFEEISDCELEEDARHKGVGDALGVDWASLIAQTKRQDGDATPNGGIDQTTTTIQKWQAHRVFLNIGISMRMAGEEYAENLLTEAKQKLNEELKQQNNKDADDTQANVVEHAPQTPVEKVENTNDDDDNDEKKFSLKSPQSKKALQDLETETVMTDMKQWHPLACIQVAERAHHMQQQNFLKNACGVNSRALSARQDLKLRRQICGLPARECDFPQPIPATSQKLKAMALAAFERALEIK